MIKLIVSAGLAFFTLFTFQASAQPVPVITQNPLSQSVVAGSDATFSATVTGQSPDYYWFFNGTNLANGGRISGARGTTLTIANITAGDAGSYYLLASNKHGTATSSSAALTVLFPPAIVLSPVAQSVVANGTASFSVTATGTAPLNYRWRRDGLELSDGERFQGTATSTLTIGGVETNDAGGYSVIVSNAVETVSSAPVALNVLVPPTIVQQPSGQGGVLGSNISFTVIATGDEPLSYAWRFNNTNLVDNGRITGSDSATLSIAGLQPADAGSYMVVVSNDVGTTNSDPVMLFVLIPPSIAQHPLSQVATNGQSFTLTSTASATAPISYQWFFNDLALNNSGRVSGAESTSLLVSNVQSNDAGHYRMVASNPYGQATSEVATITVVSPPVILEHPADKTVVSGTSNTTFHVTASGDEPLSYQWYWNGNLLTDNQKRSGCTTPDLTIANITSTDAGLYAAVISNAYGAVTSLVAELTVVLPPAISTSPRSQSAPAGLPVTLNVAAQGTQPLAYQWWFNGSPLPGATSTSLVLPALSTSDIGAYHVVATNQAGSATSATAQVTFGSVAAWGKDTFGESTPPPGLSNVIAVAGNFNSSMALRSDGTLAAWGSTKATGTSLVAIATSSGSIGLRADGTITPIEGPGVPPTSNVVAVAMGQNHILALRREGTLTMIGAQWGNTPRALNNVAAIAAGPFLSLALKSNGTVVAWGINAGTNVPPGLKDVSAIAAGGQHGLALKSNGTVIAWGTGPAATVPPGLSNVIAISTSTYSQSQSHNMALRSDGTVVAWGSNNQYDETNVPPGLSNVVAIGSVPLHSLAIVGDRRPLFLKPPVGGRAFFGGEFTLHGKATGQEPLSYQWRFNGTNLAGATTSTLSLTNVQFAAAGNYSLQVSNMLGNLESVPAPIVVNHHVPHILAIETNKIVYFGGKLALDPTVIGSGELHYQWRYFGTNLPGATNRIFSIPHARYSDSGNYQLVVSNYIGSVIGPLVVVQVKGPVTSWPTTPTTVGVGVPDHITNAIAIAAGGNHALVLRDDGTVVGFGSNFFGQTNVPPGLSNVVEIAASGNQSLALRADGTVVGWGNTSATNLTNSGIVSIEADLLGYTLLHTNGTITRGGSFGPAPANATNIIALAPFDDGYFALRAEGTFFSVAGGFPPPPTNNVMAFGSSRYHGLLLRRDGSVVSWGNPGISNSATRVTGVASTISSKWAVDADGTVIQLGATSANFPVVIPPGLADVSEIDAGPVYILALTTTRELSDTTLSDATDTAELVLSSRGSAQWFAQTNITHDGTDAARSAEIGSNTASSMRMFVAGPATVRFWWKVSSQQNSDHLSFSVGGVSYASISGETDWTPTTINIPSGRHILVWSYAKDGSGTDGQDAGWVDQIEILPPAPVIVRQPFDKNVLSGTRVQIPVAAFGASPLFYTWLKNGQPIAHATNSTLLIPVATRSDSGSYSVVVSNTTGSVTSSNAILKVIAPQVFAAPTFENGLFLLSSTDSDGGLLSESDLAFFQAQASTNLVNWVSLSNALSISNGILRLADSESTNVPARYYRIVENW